MPASALLPEPFSLPPYARRYYVQFWTGDTEPFYDGIRRDAHVETGELEDPGEVPADLDDGIVQHLRYARGAGQAELRGLRDRRTLHRDSRGRRAVYRPIPAALLRAAAAMA